MPKSNEVSKDTPVEFTHEELTQLKSDIAEGYESKIKELETQMSKTSSELTKNFEDKIAELKQAQEKALENAEGESKEKSEDKEKTAETKEKSQKRPPLFEGMNVSVKDEKSYPMATIAMAKIKAKREANGKTWLDVLKSEHEARPTASTYGAIQYEKSQLKSNADASTYHGFIEKVKAVGLGDTLDGGRVNAPGVEPGLISELLPNLAFNQIQGIDRKTLVHGQYEMSVEKEGPAGYWGQEGANLKQSDLQFDTRKFSAKKAYTFVPITNDRLRFDSSILSDIENSMNRRLTKLIDTGYISGSGNENQPLGIYNATGYSASATSSPTASKIKKDFVALVQALQNKNVDFANPYILMTPAMKTSLMNQWDSNANLVHYAKQLEDRNSIMGISVVTSNNASSDKVALLDGSEIAIADGSGFFMDADASYGFSSDTTYLRVVTYTDINYLHKTNNTADGVGIITGTNTAGSDWITS